MSEVDELAQLRKARYDQGGIGVFEDLSILHDHQQFAAAPAACRSTLARGFELGYLAWSTIDCVTGERSLRVPHRRFTLSAQQLTPDPRRFDERDRERSAAKVPSGE